VILNSFHFISGFLTPVDPTSTVVAQNTSSEPVKENIVYGMRRPFAPIKIVGISGQNCTVMANKLYIIKIPFITVNGHNCRAIFEKKQTQWQ
jgi:hypothetical protein